MKKRLKAMVRPAWQAVCWAYKRTKWDGNHRIFCISFQRTGTTSVGKFLASLGYPTAGWGISNRNDWNTKAHDGNWEAIFSSLDFRANQAFEDAPWFTADIYKVLFYKFPKSKFILLERDPEEWFKSMLSLANGKSTSTTKVHIKWYRRESEYHQLIDSGIDVPLDNGLEMAGMDQHYKDIYVTQIRENREFFAEKDPDRLFFASLSDEDKWDKMAHFLGHKNIVGSVHVNKSP